LQLLPLTVIEPPPSQTDQWATWAFLGANQLDRPLASQAPGWERKLQPLSRTGQRPEGLIAELYFTAGLADGVDPPSGLRPLAMPAGAGLALWPVAGE